MGFTTKKSLLDKIKSGEEVGWCEFRKMYTPLIAIIGRDNFHLSENEIQELIQDVMIAVFNAQKNFTYDPTKGRFGNYLRQITRNCALAILHERRKQELQDALSEELVEAESEFESKWESQYQDFILLECDRMLKAKLSIKNYQIYDMSVKQGVSTPEIMKKLKVSANQVYLTRSRILKIIKQIIESENFEDIEGDDKK